MSDELGKLMLAEDGIDSGQAHHIGIDDLRQAVETMHRTRSGFDYEAELANAQ